MRFPVRLEVPVDGGRTRTLSAHTIVVSHAGATLDLDESLPAETGLQVAPPFGGSILAEVTDAWVDDRSGRHRISIRLIDPTSWTAPERLLSPAVACPAAESLSLGPRAAQMLADYAVYLGETRGHEVTIAGAAERIIEEVFLSDAKFQDWFAAKIMEDLQAWEEAIVVRSGDAATESTGLTG